MRRLYFTVFCLMLAGCTRSGPFALQKIVLGNAVDASKNITVPATVFGPADTTIYAQAFFRPGAEPQKIEGVWWDENGQIYRTETTVTPALPVKYFWVTRESGWPAGSYRFTIQAGDQVLGEQTFEIRSGL